MFTGSIVALVTPMHPDGEIDWAKLGELIEWHITEGTRAIAPVGTTGESATVTVTVTSVNDAVTDLELSASTVSENSAPGTVVGSLSATDADASEMRKAESSYLARYGVEHRWAKDEDEPEGAN